MGTMILKFLASVTLFETSVMVFPNKNANIINLMMNRLNLAFISGVLATVMKIRGSERLDISLADVVEGDVLEFKIFSYIFGFIIKTKTFDYKFDFWFLLGFKV